MTEAWSRRQVLKQAGTAAAGMTGLSLAGVSLAGCGSVPQPQAVSDAIVVKGVRRFQSRPDLAPPLVSLSTTKSPSDPGFIMLATVASGPGQGGTMILRTSGELIWFKPDTNSSKMDLNVQTYNGKPALTWWEGRILRAGYGQGVGMVADANYQIIHKVNAANGLMADLHELNLTPDGTALVTAYRQSTADLSVVGGPSSGQLVSGVAQEIDIKTGKLLFEWDSLDYVPVEDTYQPFHYGKHVFGTKERPFDYFHINSLALAPDGDLLISSRNTWTVYKVSRSTGQIVWRMNGKKSDFTFGPGATYHWQHHVRPHSPNLMTVFDNGASPIMEKHSRALVLEVDEKKMHVSLRNQYIHPGENVLAYAMGSAQLLPDGRMFVGWGASPYFSEFTQDGQLIMDGALTKGDPSYRAFLANWVGRPLEKPAIAVQASSSGATVYASWNGATEVTSWTILAGGGMTSLSPIGSVRHTDFETAAAVSSKGPFFAVEARDASGHVLAKSATVHITSKSSKFIPVNGSCGSSNCGY